MRILVGMSGGVDSSVVALLMRREGHDVTGVTMSLWSAGSDVSPGSSRGRHACFGPDEAEDIRDAQAVCRLLSIPHVTIDCSVDYREMVLGYTQDEYLAGRTPNPCVRCNARVKFGMLLRKAREAGLGFDRFATGHYACVEHGSAGARHRLRKAVRSPKDQSYFLYRLTQEQLGKSLFPLGGLAKEQVRRVAREAGLMVAAKPESQDFYPGDYRALISRAPQPGPIVDTSGKRLGTHSGIWNYTRGQRRGLGVPSTHPLYVVELSARDNTVVVGSRREGAHSTFVACELNWIAVQALEAPGRYKVRVRSTHVEQDATVVPLDRDRVRVDFDEPVLAIAPGQSAVIYQGDEVVGGGIIQCGT